MERTIKEQVAYTWNNSSEDYDQQYAHGLKSEQEKEEWMKLLGGLAGTGKKKILDVGTGTGFLSLLLAELGHECKGIDLSEGMMEKAKIKAERAGLPIQFTTGDAEDLSGEADGSYDLVINRHLLWTLPHPDQAVAEWIRVLKPAGKLVVIDGDWFHGTLRQKISVFCGRVLQAIAERKNPWKNNDFYSDCLINSLPMMHPENARQVEDFIRRSTLSEITVYDATQIEAAEQEAMPFYVKLLNPYRRKIICGVKSDG